MRSSDAVRIVAMIECLKGAVVLLAASGFLALIHHDVHRVAAVLVEHAHLNPASKYPRIFVDAAAQVNDTRLWQLAGGAIMYSSLRLVEAYGLYRGHSWAELLAALSGAVYVPFEVIELVNHPTLLVLGLLALNLGVVALMARALYLRSRQSMVS